MYSVSPKTNVSRHEGFLQLHFALLIHVEEGRDSDLAVNDKVENPPAQYSKNM